MLVPWLVIAFLTVLNALYVAAEFSAVAVRRSEIDQLARDGSKTASGLLEILEDGPSLDRYIAACQIGITLSGLISGAYAQATISLDLAPRLAMSFELSEIASHSAAALLVLIGLTTLQVVFGELIPKTIALEEPAKTALFTYLPTRLSASLYRLPVWLTNGTALLLLRPFGISATKHGHIHTPGEIEYLLAESRRGGTVSEELHQRLERGLKLSSQPVRKLMIPRNRLIAIEISTPAEEVLQILRKSPYSRLPVYREKIDDILGAISTKDVIAFYAEEKRLPPLEDFLRPMPFVPESLSADRLVRMLQEKRASKAIVVNEFGGVEGLITIEDVLEEVFGDLSDEMEPDEPGAQLLEGGVLRLPGVMPLDDAREWLGEPECEFATTIGGLVNERLGHLPTPGEAFVEGDYTLKVIAMNPTSVAWVELHPIDPSEAETLDDEEAGA